MASRPGTARAARTYGFIGNINAPRALSARRRIRMTEFRVEKDFLGEVKVPKDAYWGVQTQRAIENFPISGIRFGRRFIYALGLIKMACAQTNMELGLLDNKVGKAIVQACQEVMDGKLDAQFPLDIFQTGSGTSTNMNANEVIANRAHEIRDQHEVPGCGESFRGPGGPRCARRSKRRNPHRRDFDDEDRERPAVARIRTPHGPARAEPPRGPARFLDHAGKG